MELVDILVLGTSAARRAGSSPAEGINTTSYLIYKSKEIFLYCIEYVLNIKKNK
jgi:ribonuclease BN (tRNA processing enzyme)